MLPDRVSNPGPLTYESGALPIALRGPAYIHEENYTITPFNFQALFYLQQNGDKPILSIPEKLYLRKVYIILTKHCISMHYLLVHAYLICLFKLKNRKSLKFHNTFPHVQNENSMQHILLSK